MILEKMQILFSEMMEKIQMYVHIIKYIYYTLTYYFNIFIKFILCFILGFEKITNQAD